MRKMAFVLLFFLPAHSLAGVENHNIQSLFYSGQTGRGLSFCFWTSERKNLGSKARALGLSVELLEITEVRPVISSETLPFL